MMNFYVPEIQINGSLKSVFQVSFLTTANFDALLVDAIHQAGDCAHPFPAEIPGTTDCCIHCAEQAAVKRLTFSKMASVSAVFLNLGLGHCAQSVILAMQEIGDGAHTGQGFR